MQLNKLSFDEKKFIVVEYEENSDCFWDAVYKQCCDSTKSMSHLKSEFKNHLSKFKKIEDDDIRSREREIKDLSQHIFKKNAYISKLNILLPILKDFLKSNIIIWSFNVFKDEVKLMVHKDGNNYLHLKHQYNNKEKYNINSLLCNSGQYIIQKKKLFNKNCSLNNSVSKDEYNKKKSVITKYYKF